MARPEVDYIDNMENHSRDDILAHRIKVLEDARDHLSARIEELKVRHQTFETRLVATETIQPLLSRALDEIKEEVGKANSRLGQIGLAVILALVGGIVTWIMNGGLTVTPGVGN